MSLGLQVDVVPSGYDEQPIAGLLPRDLAIVHARGKAGGAAASPHLIVAADTVVDLDGEALGKPRDLAASQLTIERLSGRTHDVHTAFALRDDTTQQTIIHCETTRVQFSTLDTATIAMYVATGDGLDKAGAYGIQGFGATLIERIEGDYFTVVGFPLAAFARSLPTLGYVLSMSASAREAGTLRTEVHA